MTLNWDPPHLFTLVRHRDFSLLLQVSPFALSLQAFNMTPQSMRTSLARSVTWRMKRGGSVSHVVLISATIAGRSKFPIAQGAKVKHTRRWIPMFSTDSTASSNATQTRTMISKPSYTEVTSTPRGSVLLGREGRGILLHNSNRPTAWSSSCWTATRASTKIATHSWFHLLDRPVLGIKMLMDQQNLSDDLGAFQTPVCGVPGDCVPTTGDVHLYSDPLTN
ncbi:hypothetical protein QBC37DRAFT_12040 [Rhypophila decipiens]|uniref:Uncharacterized protein n=1 Tax=Rhypophila decipiens TaxID=261697 RepID=A0AAN6Y486_9PEZI|nr:hypothetical protein QBC37DRAFT_12040 [Rhypophila decipiens]